MYSDSGSDTESTRHGHTICQYPGCSRTAWQDQHGSRSSYCGKTHRDAMKQLDVNSPPESVCKNCNARPVYVENGYAHDFCGRRCHDSYEVSQGNPRGHAERQTDAPVCKLSNCQRPVFVGTNGVASEYCSNTHRADAVTAGEAEACLLCAKWPKAVVNGQSNDFCSKRCRGDALLSAPVILNVSENTAAFGEVSTQFRTQWRHPESVPTVVKVWKIYTDKGLSDEFFRHKLAIERKTGLPGGNSRRRWHGTIRACTIGDSDSQHDLCDNLGCSVCKIIRTSFSIDSASSIGNFGVGIYTSATSSKADTYVRELGESPFKAMVLSDVVMGNTIKMTTGDSTLTEPPNGYDSVVGEPGGALRYDEAIVYKNEAIRPLFLVIYMQ